MAMTNTAKPSSGTMADTSRPSNGETWASISTTWATETRTWLATISLLSGTTRVTNSMANTARPS